MASFVVIKESISRLLTRNFQQCTCLSLEYFEIFIANQSGGKFEASTVNFGPDAAIESRNCARFASANLPFAIRSNRPGNISLDLEQFSFRVSAISFGFIPQPILFFVPSLSLHLLFRCKKRFSCPRVTSHMDPPPRPIDEAKLIKGSENKNPDNGYCRAF